MSNVYSERENVKVLVVCVVIPARNEEEPLPTTLKILKAQTLRPRVMGEVHLLESYKNVILASLPSLLL